MSIHIQGRRWFQRTYGNTYHTAEIFIDGQSVHTTPKQYGYGDQYIETALSWLEENGHLPYDGGMPKRPNWQIMKDAKISSSVADVRRERDL